MSIKDFDLFLSYEPARDMAPVVKLVRRLTGAQVRVWFSEWELGPGQVPEEVADSVISRSTAVCICNAGIANHAAAAQAHGVECIAVDLTLGEDTCCALLTAALAKQAEPAASARSLLEDPVERAVNILRGELPDLIVIKDLVKSLKALKQFG